MPHCRRRDQSRLCGCRDVERVVRMAEVHEEAVESVDLPIHARDVEGREVSVAA